MDIDIAHLAAATAATLAPFMPYLVDVGKAGGQKLAEVIAEKGGELAWTRAQRIWDKITTRWSNDPVLTSAATMVAVEPNDESVQMLLTKQLVSRLETESGLAKEIFDLLGGNTGVQEVVADNQSWIENVVQELQGRGTQSVHITGGSKGIGIRQTQIKG